MPSSSLLIGKRRSSEIKFTLVQIWCKAWRRADCPQRCQRRAQTSIISIPLAKLTFVSFVSKTDIPYLSYDSKIGYETAAWQFYLKSALSVVSKLPSQTRFIRIFRASRAYERADLRLIKCTYFLILPLCNLPLAGTFPMHSVPYTFHPANRPLQLRLSRSLRACCRLKQVRIPIFYLICYLIGLVFVLSDF